MSTKENPILEEAAEAQGGTTQHTPRVPSAAAGLRATLQKFGAKSLTNAELMALVLTAHRHHATSLACAKRLVASYTGNTLRELALTQWVRESGIGFANACRMAAVFEMGRRFFAVPQDEPRVGTPAEAYALVRDLKILRKEHLVALCLDAQNSLLARETVSIGSLNTTRTHPREVMQPAVLHSALAFILAHNRPSGSLEASRDDVEFTRTMQKAGELMGVSLYDHLIVSRSGYVSLREKGLL
jgi:DNA repair protein RadC